MFSGWNLVWVLFLGCVFLYFGSVRLRQRRNKVRRDVLALLSTKTVRTTKAELVSAARNRHKHPSALIEEAIRDLLTRGEIREDCFSEGGRQYVCYVINERRAPREGRST